MNGSIVGIVCGLSLCCSAVLGDGFLVKHGQSTYRIVVSADAIPAERTAAKELQHFLAQSTGVTLPVVSEAGDAPAIFVGQSEESARALGISDWGRLRADEICLKTAGRNLHVAGERPRGTLYAVYEFLETHVGVRFWTPKVTDVPRHRDLSLPQLSVRYAPQMDVRSAGYDFLIRDYRFAARCRNNGFLFHLPEAWGGDVQVLGNVHSFCHNSTPLLPVETYFGKHPDWYALVNGQRLGIRKKTQLCLTNQTMRKELIRNVLKLLRKHPETRYVSVSQNDNVNFCRCPTCEAFVKSHGNQTDLLMDAVNEVTEAVVKEFPKVRVETLAYLYTREAPKTVRPHDSVVIRYCTSNAFVSQSMNHEANRSVKEELVRWKACARQLMVWHYVANFAKYYLPHPNWHALGEDLRFFRDCGTVNIFEQGSWNECGPVADLSELRAWVLSKLMWNPDLNQQTLMEEFISGYYGRAASGVREYLAVIQEAVRRHPELRESCYSMKTDAWLDQDLLVRGYRAMMDLIRRVGHDTELGHRVVSASLPIRCAALERGEVFKRHDMSEFDFQLALKETVSDLKRVGVKGMDEHGMKPQIWEATVLSDNGVRMGTLPNDGVLPDGIAKGHAWSCARIATLHSLGVGCFKEKDSKAVSERAVRMPTNHTQWLVQIHKFPRGLFDLYVEVRCDETSSGNAMKIGVYDKNLGRDSLSMDVDSRSIAGKGYKLVKIGQCDFSPSSLIYMAPVLGGGRNVWIDRVLFVPVVQ